MVICGEESRKVLSIVVGMWFGVLFSFWEVIVFREGKKIKIGVEKGSLVILGFVEV